MAQGAGLRARIADAARFMACPTPCVAPLPWGRALVLALLAVFALDLALDTLVTQAIALIDQSAGFLPEPIAEDTTLAEDLFGFLLFAPVIEELLWRGWLSGRVAALRFALYGFAALGLMTAGWLAEGDAATFLAFAGVVAALAGLAHWLATRGRDTAVPAWFTRNFRWLVWGSSLSFGLIHLGNYEPLASPFGVLVVLPHMIGGLLLAYVRTRLGLAAAMLHHATYNAVFLAGDYGVF